MRVLMVGRHAGVFRALDPVMRELGRREHQIVLHGARQEEGRLPEIAGVTSAERLEPAENWPRRLRVGRQLIRVSEGIGL